MIIVVVVRRVRDKPVWHSGHSTHSAFWRSAFQTIPNIQYSYVVCCTAQGQMSSGTRSSRHLRVRVYAGVNLARKDIFGARYMCSL